ncbi:MAG TPA: sugar phosphate isomerase/epimerase [Candidatus Dormibacteraeota bacterium]|jgi:inosose dehydratase|nr:sugar phosphate isomerase/epimerase [Candidatus Dormibacteraeota bacterium]
MTLRFAYSTINWGADCDLTQAAAEIRESGWRAVELFGHSLDLVGTPASLRRRIGGLEVATLFGHVRAPFRTPAQIEGHRRQLEFAAEVGAAAYGLVGGTRLRQRTPLAGEYADLAALLEEISVYGAELGVDVAYHPHSGCTVETAEETDLVLGQAPHAKLCLDVSHVALAGENAVEQLRHFRERISYIHLKDWADGHFVGLGEGILTSSWPAIMSEISGSGFDGWVVVEQSRSDVSPADSASANAGFLRQLGYEPAATVAV